MKKSVILLTCISTLSFNANAEGWFDSLKNLIGLGETKEQVQTTNEATEQAAQSPDIMGIIGQLTNTLDVNKNQAEGGVASLINLAKSNLSSGEFSDLAKSLPGVDSILSKVPSIEGLSSGNLGGLLDKASEYSDSLKSINEVKKQFEALGLKPEMITSFVTQIQSYLNTEQGQDAKKLLTEGLGKLLG